MRVILARHGESVAGRQKLHQSIDAELSKTGQMQARLLGRELNDHSASSVISSDLLRAKQTALIVGNVLNLEVVQSPLFNEWRRPSEIVGRPFDDGEAKRVKRLLKTKYTNPDWHYSDEENFYDVFQRAESALKFLTIDGKDKIVITHARFLTVILWILSTDVSLPNPVEYLHRQKDLYIETGEKRDVFYDGVAWHQQALSK